MELNLQKLGLTRIESKVYYTLLRLGPVKATALITETELHKATVYETLRMLMKKGLVNYTTKEKVKYYEAADPTYLLHLIEEEKERLLEKEKTATSFISELKRMKDSVKKREVVRVYQGKEGAKLVFEDILSYKSYLSFSSQGEMEHVMGNYYYHFQARKRKLRIRSKIIISQADVKKEFVKSIYGEIRVL
ncbi:MAG: helix-turn-helix domain-containing protein, partial [Nanoarchaeota archaeon]